MPESLFHRRQSTQRFGELFNHLGENRSFRSRDPLEAKPLRLDAGELEKLFVQRQPLGGAMIATNIVAVAHVSTQHHHSICPFLEGAQD